MVVFKNITFDADWIEADAYVSSTKSNFHVKIHRREERIDYSPKDQDTWQLFAGCWALVDEVNNGKVNGTSHSIVWG